MMRAILRGSVLAFLLGVVSEGRLAGLPSSVRSQQVTLDVAVPDKATVVRKQGKPSLTGQLTTFNQASLTLSAVGHSEKIPLTQVQSIDFEEGDIWIEGQRLPVRFRGYVKIWSGLSVTDLKLQNPPHSANIDLNKVLTPEELQKLLNVKDKVRVLSKVSFDSPGTITVETFTMPKP